MVDTIWHEKKSKDYSFQLQFTEKPSIPFGMLFDINSIGKTQRKHRHARPGFSIIALTCCDDNMKRQHAKWYLPPSLYMRKPDMKHRKSSLR